MTAPALELVDITAGYGGGVVLNGLNLTLAAGSVTALLGRNGAGKTTLCRICAGLLRPTRGTVRISGTALNDRASHTFARHGVGLVPQGREVFGRLSVEENLRLGAIGKNMTADLVAAYRWFPPLEVLRNRAAGSLSGGEQQMLAIARTLMGAPRLLVLDEPSEGLAPAVTRVLAASLREIAAEAGLTVLLVEQDLELIQALASTCCFLADGGIAETVPVASIGMNFDLVRRHLAL